LLDKRKRETEREREGVGNGDFHPSIDDFYETDWLNEWTVMSHDNFVSIQFSTVEKRMVFDA
jgi:hypothetical protein